MQYTLVYQSDIRRLQQVHNIAAKVILEKSKYDSTSDCLRELHWIPVKTRIDFKILTLVYKCVHGQAPNYFINLLTCLPERHQGLRLNGKYKRPVIPFTKRKTFAVRSFSVIGPTLWNSIPSNIRRSKTITKFQKELKTFMFTRLYE